MRQVADPGARLHLAVGAALLACLALLLLSGSAAGAGEMVTPHAPDVLSGEPFRFNITMAGLDEPTGEQAQVHCVPCGKSWTSQPITLWRRGAAPGQWNATLTFPSAMFPQSAGEPSRPGTYLVRVVGAASPLAEANVTVHLLDAWRQANGTYSVTDRVHIQVGGLNATQAAHVNITKWKANGGTVRVANLTLPSVGGKGVHQWTIPKEHAADMHCPLQNQTCQDYRLDVEVPGRPKDTVRFRAQPAELKASIRYLTPDAPDDSPVPGIESPRTYNRTQNVTVQVEVRYLNNLPMNATDRILQGNAALNGTLPIAVERVVVSPANPNGTPTERVATLYARSTPQGWRATWHVPRDINTTVAGGDNPQYRFRLLPGEDRHDNLIPALNATPFRVAPMRIVPRVVLEPGAEVERLTNATAVFLMRYADGTPFSNQTNKSLVKAGLVGPDGDEEDSATMSYLGNGLWRADFQPGIRFRPLGPYAIRVREAPDHHDNAVQPNSTAVFDIVPARPRIDLRTYVAGDLRDGERGFARGEGVSVEATITYPNGSAFNKDRLPQGQRNLTVTVHKVDGAGIEKGTLTFHLDHVQGSAGLWTGALAVPEHDLEAPLGAWRWDLRVQDKEAPDPNANDTTFVRPVRGAAIHVAVLGQPEPIVRAGSTATARFSALYPNGTALDEALAHGGVRVLVHRWKDQRAGEVADSFWPEYNATTGEWRAAWRTHTSTRVGAYALALEGEDRHGNLLQRVLTRPVEVYVDTLERPVLVQPAEAVRRGEEALVVFDGAAGDLPEEGRAKPRVEVQKWNAARHAWEAQVADVWAPGPNATDHLGRLKTDPTTNLGKYRFVLHARTAQHARLEVASREFQVLPVEMQRNWTGHASNMTNASLPKGLGAVLQVERLAGDRLEGASVRGQGGLLVNLTPVAKVGRFEVQWRPSYTLPDGPYVAEVRGRDVHNNSWATPPLTVHLTGTSLSARMPAPPEAAVQRAHPLELRVLVQYPDDQAVKGGNFSALLVRGNQTVAEVGLESNRSAWLGTWRIPSDAELGRYRVLVSGHDGLGNRVARHEVFSFQLAEGVLERAFARHPALGNRTEAITWLLPAGEQDADVRFVLRDERGERSEMPFNLTRDGAYQVTWRPGKDTPLGRYVLEAQGEDVGRNAILAKSRTLLLRPAVIGSVFLDPPKVLLPGEVARWEFELRYTDRTLVPIVQENAPQVAIISAGQVVSPPPTLAVREDGQAWVATWVPEPGRHAGVYALAVGGKDQHGNEVQARLGPNARVDEGVVKELLGVPGFEAALLPAALLGAALLARRRRA